jgi:hypothetical protein
MPQSRPAEIRLRRCPYAWRDVRDLHEARYRKRSRPHVIREIIAGRVFDVSPGAMPSIDATITGRLVYLERRWGNRTRPKPLAIGSKSDAVKPVLRISAHCLRKLGAQRRSRCYRTSAAGVVRLDDARSRLRFTKKANRARLEARNKNRSVPLFPGVASGGTIRL